MHVSILAWRGHRYFKLGSLMVVLCSLLYVTQWGSASQPPNGGTWQGYVLGTLAALLIVWLSLLGVRKRSYRSSMGSVQGWTSAHVYLGGALLVIATLHCALQFGWNVHTLAYVLMCLVVLSGFYGLYVYMHLPSRIAVNGAEKDRSQWLEELDKLDTTIRETVQRCDAELQAMALSALDLTRLGGSVWQQLAARDDSRVEPLGGGKPVANAGQQLVIDELARRVPDASRRVQAEVLSELLAQFGRRQVILQVLRRDIQFKGMLRIWLYLHIPLTAGLLVALLVHVLSVFLYW